MADRARTIQQQAYCLSVSALTVQSLLFAPFGTEQSHRLTRTE